jgi:hypothetical protein
VGRRGGGGLGRRLLVLGGLLLLIGAAGLSPMVSVALAPLQPLKPPQPPQPIAAATARPTVAPTPLATPRPSSVPTSVAPLASPTPSPQPSVVPTPSASGQALLAGIEADATAHWLKNHAETALRSGPSDDAQVFTQLPQWSTLRQVDSRPDWLLVQYGGDGATRQPGPGWVKAADVGAIDAPSIWLASNRPASLWSAPTAAAQRTLDLPPSILMEVVGPDRMQGSRVHVRLPGDGRHVPPAEGWMDADALVRTASPGPFQIPRAYPADLRADVRISVPYRTQLDGAAYAGANCGPTVLGMALESFGMNEPPPDLRREVLRTEVFDENDDDAGSYIWALAEVAQDKGLHPHGLYEDDGQTLHHWTTDEIRQAVKRGQPVIVQVVYRGLPGREESGYYGDHYVVITGLVGDDFLYNDPIGGAPAHEAPGYDRIMTAGQLERAMRASDRAYAFTAFSLSRT